MKVVALYEQGKIPDEITPEDAMQGAFREFSDLPALDGNRLTLDIPSRVIILRLRPTNAVADSQGPQAPLKISGTATENQIDVRVELPPDSHAEEVYLFRNDKHIATLLAKPELTFTDNSAWIRPGLGYRYTARTVAADGRMSPITEGIIVTPDKRPDFIVGDFGPDIEEIQAGDLVTFSGSIRNVGDGASQQPAPPNVGMWNSSVALAFRVNDQVVSWGGDGGQEPFQPGEERSFSATGGPDGRHHWTATEGTHVLRAAVDDINRIASERKKTNNIASRSITVGNFPGALAMESRPAPGTVDLTTEGKLDWVHFGGWQAEGSISRKRGAHLISNVTQVGEGHIGVTDGSPVSMSWSDGEGVESAKQQHSGLWGNHAGNGYLLSVPAGKEERTLRLYASGINGVKGELRARLSDGSAPEIICTSWNGNRSHDWSPIPDSFSAVYTLRFRAASEDATLSVSWILHSEPNRFQGQIRLQAATLE
ncbi:MAG: hypothetical protein ACFCU3_06845 [Verrucomicrobiales bacterium]